MMTRPDKILSVCPDRPLGETLLLQSLYGNASGRPATIEIGESKIESCCRWSNSRYQKQKFSENNPMSQFFITVEGVAPKVFEPNDPPAVETTQGSVEEWTIENRSLENHEFHIHQIHFQVLSQNNFEVNGSQPDRSIDGQFLDTVQIPFWDGDPSHPFPSVKLRMDFRGVDIGDFVYHCHIAEHEDDGMMAIIRVKPRPDSSQLSKKPESGTRGQPLRIRATSD